MDDLFKFLFKATSVAPSYTADHCLAVKQSVSACSACRDVCPHQAISISREVEIDEIDCSGCGLCVQSCPSQALAANIRYRPAPNLTCSKVSGGDQTIHCLGRLSPSDILALAGRQESVTLVHADCADCSIGSPDIPMRLETTCDKARALSQLQKRKLSIQLLEVAHYRRSAAPERLSRRELLRGGWRGVQRTTAEALAPLDPGDEENDSLPREMQRQLRLIAVAAPQPATLVPWILPRVADGCILCPVCTNVCPTAAFRRDFEPSDQEGAVLLLEPERCMGCEACVKACPVKVITLDDQVCWEELSGGTVVAHHRPPRDDLEGNMAR